MAFMRRSRERSVQGSRLFVAPWLSFCSVLALTAQPLLANPARSQTDATPTAAPQWKHYPTPNRAPEGAPNILLVLTDDVGFSAASAFGGAIPTPAFDQLARAGLRYTQFHVTAMCSPTRAALLTGRNHHAVGSGAISDVSMDEEGYTSVIPASAATLGRVLKDVGYDTAWFGKNHNTPPWETGPMGPFERWPNGMGFDYFYGFNGAAADQFNPSLVENRNLIRRDPADADYILDRDMADRMLEWLQAQHSVNNRKPFFLYLAPGAMHDPQQAPAEWIEKFKGKFDGGWDVLREETFRRQKAMGIIPSSAVLAPPLPGVPAWNSLSKQQQQLYARMMEIAAAQLAYMDHQFGRVIDHLRKTGQLDNTMVIFIQGDNGAALHTFRGSLNAYAAFAGIEETDEEMAAEIAKLGGPDSFGNYPVGWAYATNTPFNWGKTVGSQLGGLRNGLVISWPKAIEDKGAIRTQFSHVIDIAPTIYEAVGIEPPAQVDGVVQQPIDGISMAYTFDDATAPSRRREQYFEMLGSRAFYKDGWFAGTSVNWEPWKPNKSDPLAAAWELYNLEDDFSQVRNLAARYPEKLAEMQAGFEAAARKYHVYPLSADFFSRLDPSLRPSGLSSQGTYRFYPGEIRYSAFSWPELSARWNARARVRIASVNDRGPIMAQGTRFSGYRLALENGAPVFVYDPSGRAQERRTLRGPALTPGDHEIEVGFTPGETGAIMRMKVDGKPVADAKVDRIIRIMSGEAVVGRAALDDDEGPRRCDCTIGEVVITTR